MTQEQRAAVEAIAKLLEPFIIADHRLCVSTDWSKQRAKYIAKRLVSELGLVLS